MKCGWLLSRTLMVSGLMVFLACGQATAHQKDQFRPGETWNDTSGAPINAHGGGVLCFNDVYYWYGEIKSGKTWAPESNKSWGGTRVEMVGISCYSSRDLYHWKNEGNVLPAVQDDPKSELHKSKVLERPKVIYNQTKKKFVMWMHVDSEDYSLAHAGVAAADSPTGPFHYLGSCRPDGAMSRDLTIFQDDDGKAYLFHSSEDNATMHVSMLSDDYLKLAGHFERIFIGRSMEAPAVFKHKGRYYAMASGCTGWAPNPARSAVADSIMGPWKELDNPCRGADADITFHCQSTFILPVAGKQNGFICMLDRWSQNDLPDSRYVWLPISMKEQGFEIVWTKEWNLDAFAK